MNEAWIGIVIGAIAAVMTVGFTVKLHMEIDDVRDEIDALRTDLERFKDEQDNRRQPRTML